MANFDDVAKAAMDVQIRTGLNNFFYVCGNKPFIALLEKDEAGKNTFNKLYEPKDADDAVRFMNEWSPT